MLGKNKILLCLNAIVTTYFDVLLGKAIMPIDN